MGIETESRVIDKTKSPPLSDGTFLERTKGANDPPSNMPPYGRGPASLRRDLPEPLKKDTGTLSSKDWLPEGLFPELDELREEHHALLDELRSEGGKVTELYERYKAEDEARQEALNAGEEPPPVTGTADRTDALNEASARHWAVVEGLAAFCDRAIGVIQEKWGKLPEFPDDPGTLPEWRQEFANEKAEADKIVEEAKAIMRQAERDVADIEHREMWLDKTSGQRANAGRYMPAPKGGTRPTRAEREARRVPEFLREGVAG